MSGFRGVIGRTAKASVPYWEPEVKAPDNAPSVIYLVFDDVGFSDFGCYGSEIDTPNLDRLARGGLRYTNFHTTALCSPTRASLLTGRNHHSVGMATLSNWDTGFPGSRGRIAKSAGTIAEMLRPHGYNTFAVGKWHLTPMTEVGPAGPYDQWPTQRGFDRYYGFLDGATNQWDPVLTEDNHPIEKPNDPDYHLTVDLIDKAIDLISNQTSVAPEKPFFMYLGLGACHSPHHVPQRYIDKYMPVFEKGWDQTRNDRFARQLASGIVPAGTELPDRNPGITAWDELSDEARRVALIFQAAYAGMLDHADEQIGRLVAALEKFGRLENTIFVVISDNGASQEGSPHGTLHQGRYFERAPMTLDQTLERIGEVGETQWFNNYPLGWAMAGNTPLRWYKQTTHGGGVRDPLIIHWPKGIDAANSGQVRNQFHHVSDLTPTVLELIGVESPESINGVTQQPIEGTSLAYSFHAPEAPTRKHTQYFEMFGHRGIVHDGWKAVSLHAFGVAPENDEWELYNLTTDFSEAKNLAAAEPDRLREMVDRWWVEAGKHQVLPIDEKGGGTHRMAAPVRERFVLFPGVKIQGDSAPQFINRNYRITARIEVPEGGCSGVLIAHGDRWGGYSMYVRPDGRPVHHYHFPMEHSVVIGDAPLTPGAHAICWELTKVGRIEGRGTFSVDGVEVGRVDIPRIMRGWLPFEGLDVGCDRGSPVGDYNAPFAFTGVLHDVTVELIEGSTNTAIAVDAEMGKQ